MSYILLSTHFFITQTQFYHLAINCNPLYSLSRPSSGNLKVHPKVHALSYFPHLLNLFISHTHTHTLNKIKFILEEKCFICPLPWKPMFLKMHFLLHLSHAYIFCLARFLMNCRVDPLAHKPKWNTDLEGRNHKSQKHIFCICMFLWKSPIYQTKI